MTDWPALIQRVIDAHERLRQLRHRRRDSQVLPPWTGPATSDDIRDTEARLGASLPAGYVDYLRTVNGQHLISDLFGPLFECKSLRWFREQESEWIDAYVHPDTDEPPLDDVTEADHLVYGPGQDSCRFRMAYLPELLQIGDSYEGAVYLLNPRVLDREGEWEAWAFANWYPGAWRFRSFEELVVNELNDELETIRLLELPFDREEVLARIVAKARAVMAAEGCD